MPVRHKLQVYVPAHVSDWIRQQASDQNVSISVVVRDLLVDTWHGEMDSRKRPAALDPIRQNIFMTVALDALLSSHADGSLRQRTHEAYNRRLVRLGLASSSQNGGPDEA